MKNKLSCLLVLTSLLGLGFISNQQNHEDLIDYNYDVLSTNVKRYALSEMRTSSGVETSKIYVQTATKDNEHYLRFATAVKGDVASIKFTRELIGIEETETVKAVTTKEINTLYKGISSGEETSYFSGSQELIDQQITSTKDYYWACYTIKFSENSSYLSTPIRMTLSINDEEIKTRTTSFKDALNNVYNEDLVDYLDLAGDNYNITLKNITGETGIIDNNYSIPQGGCTDGKYLYYALNKMGAEETKLVKYDIAKKTATFSDVIQLGAQTWTQTSGKTFIYHNMIGLILQDGSIKFFDKDTLKEDATQPLKFTGALKTADIYDISYNEKLDRFVLINRKGNMYYAANDLVTYDSGIKIAVNDDLNDMSTDDNYIYAVCGKDGLIGGNISIYDWYGNKIKEKINFNDKDNKTGIILDEKVNAQSIIRLNDKYYCAINRFGVNAGLYVCELEFANNANKTTLDFNFTDSIDYIEKTNKNISEFKCQQLLKYGGKQARGACTDGNYMYLSLTNSGAFNTKLVKYNIKTNRIEKETKEFVINTNIEYSQTKGSSFIYNDNIYVCTENNQFKIFDKDLNALNNGENVSLFKDFTDSIVDVEYNDTLKRFAIIGKQDIYIYDTEGNKITSKGVIGSFYSSNFMSKDEWLVLQDVTSTDKYIYTLSNANGILGGGISIFDWNGNSCDTLKETFNENDVKSFVFHNTTSKCVTSDGSYNGQSIIINDNNLYFIALNYGAESGTFVFKTKFSFNK